ncbi:MAG: hypothetical protein U0P46_14065 [Holophagaceae bacterium]
MQRLLLPLLALLTTFGCVAPHVVPSTQSQGFRLSDLRSQRVAVFPIATVELDESAYDTVAAEYKSRNAFLDALSAKFSKRVVSICKEPSLDSSQVQTLLLAGESTKALLDPATLLGTQNPNNRFAEAVPSSGMATLERIPELKGVRYALVVRDLGVGRQWNTTSSMGGGFVSAGPGGGTFVGGGSSSSAKTSARLRLVILDLEAKAVAWDGAIFADASSTFMKATALHEVEEDLTAHFVNSILGIK